MTRRLRDIHPTTLVKISILSNLCLAAGKALVGIATFSLFFCVNALYNVGIAYAKYCILDGMGQGKDRDAQVEGGRKAGCILLVASILYMLYSVRMFISPPTTHYPMVLAIAIAAFTFTEIAWNLRGVCSKKVEKVPLGKAAKLVNLASSIICLMLTQRAILSFASPEENLSHVNGLTGLFFGGIAVLLGLTIMLRTENLIQQGNEPACPHDGYA